MFMYDPRDPATRAFVYNELFGDESEDGRWDDVEEWYNTYKELLEREVGEDD